MGIVQAIDETNWLLVSKNKGDAAKAKADRVQNEADSIVADFSNCETTTRLIYPIKKIEDSLRESSRVRVLNVVLKLSRKKLDVENSIEWIALLQGSTADNVRFWKKLETFPLVVDKKRDFSWSISVSGLSDSVENLFLGIQFVPRAQVSSVQFVSVHFSDDGPQLTPAPPPAIGPKAPAPIASVEAPAPAPKMVRKEPVAVEPRAQAGRTGQPSLPSLDHQSVILLPIPASVPQPKAAVPAAPKLQPATSPPEPQAKPPNGTASTPVTTVPDANRRGRVVSLPDSWICLFASLNDARAGKIQFKPGASTTAPVLTLDASGCDQEVRLLRPVPDAEGLVRSLPKGTEQPFRLRLKGLDSAANSGVNRIDVVAGTTPSETSMYLMSLAKRSVGESLSDIQWDMALGNDFDGSLNLYCMLQIAPGGGPLRISGLELNPGSSEGAFVLDGVVSDVPRQG